VVDRIELRHPETNELIGLMIDGIEYRIVDGTPVPLAQLKEEDSSEKKGEDNGTCDKK